MTTRARKGSVEARAFLSRLAGPLTLGGTLAAIRQSEEWSLADMGLQLGVSRMHLCDIEKGRRSVSPGKAAEWARALGYDEAQFVRLALQDMVHASGLNMDVEVAPRRQRRAGR